MKNRNEIDGQAVPKSLIRLDDANIRRAGEGEFGCFPPPPDVDELKRLLASDRSMAAKMRTFGWISG
jgi:hypothetical protein